MTVPLIVLAVLSTVGGLIGVPYALEFAGRRSSDMNYIEQTLEPVVAQVPAARRTAQQNRTTEARLAVAATAAH